MTRVHLNSKFNFKETLVYTYILTASQIVLNGEQSLLRKRNPRIQLYIAVRSLILGLLCNTPSEIGLLNLDGAVHDSQSPTAYHFKPRLDMNSFLHETLRFL